MDANGASGTVTETTKGTPGMLPPGATATVAGFAGGTFNDTGFQVTFGGTAWRARRRLARALGFTGASGFLGETAKGGAIDNQGWIDGAQRQPRPGGDAPMPASRSRSGRRSR